MNENVRPNTHVAQALAAQRMTESLDGLPSESADPGKPQLGQKDVTAIVHQLRLQPHRP